MNWYYESGGQRQGPVSDDELERLLKEGKITPDTLVWCEGMANWTPLRIARSSTPGSESSPPPDYVRCTLTGKYFPPSEIIYLEGKPYSAEAKPRAVQYLKESGSVPDPFGPEGTEPAWERRETLGIAMAAWETIKTVLTKPDDVFSRLKQDGGLWTPLSYNLLMGSIGGIAALIFRALIQTAAILPQSGHQNALAAAGGGLLMTIVMAVLMPVFVTIGTFVAAGVLHFALSLLNGANRPFETTFRVYAYCAGSGAVFQLIPICGSSIGGIWSMVCVCIGIAKAQNISGGKAVLAVVLPMLVCCALLGTLFMLGFSAFAFSQHH